MAWVVPWLEREKCDDGTSFRKEAGIADRAYTAARSVTSIPLAGMRELEVVLCTLDAVDMMTDVAQSPAHQGN